MSHEHAAHSHHHHHAHDKRFPFERMGRLDSPDRHARQPAEGLVDVVAERSPRHVLDIGAGTGYFALPLLERLPGARLAALDVEPRMLGVVLGRAMERGLVDRVEAVEVEADDAERLPLPDDDFDAAFMVNFYHELDDRPGYLAEVRRVLAPGGRLVVCDWDPEGKAEAGPPLEIRVPAETAERELKAAGFATVTRRALYDEHYTLVAE